MEKHPTLEGKARAVTGASPLPNKSKDPGKAEAKPVPAGGKRKRSFELFTRPTAEFTRALATEIVKNLSTIGRFTSQPFKRAEAAKKKQLSFGESPILLDTSVLIDGRIVPIVNSGFLAGTLIVPEFVLKEVQHIADSSDTLRRAKGRRGLEAAGKLKWQRVNDKVKTKVVREDEPTVADVDGKLVALAKRWKMKLMTVDFNLAQRARATGIKVLNINDLAQAIKLSVVPGEELTIKITHEGKERQQGVGYLNDGTMVIVEDTRDKVGLDVVVIVIKVHQTPAGQLFFARLK